MSADAMVELIRACPPGPWPKRHEGGRNIPERTWACWDVTRNAMKTLADEFIRDGLPVQQYPEYRGRGIVICAGAAPVPRAGLGTGGYMASAWVAIRKLMHLKCRLPIQVWHLGPLEADPTLAKLLAPYGVEFVDARVMERAYPCRINCGWESKLFAALYCSFQEVLFLDADCAPIGQDPEALFDAAEYRRHGSAWFPDFPHWRLKPGQWAAFGLPHRDELAFESGQFLVDKSRCLRELRLALWYAEHSDYTFEHVYGDKECPHLAWRRLGTEYAMPRPPGWEHGVCIVQHDFAGRRQFLHRCQDKWKWRGTNRRCDGLEDEALHHDLAAEFGRVWDGKLWANPTMDRDELAVHARLAGKQFTYARMPQPGFAGDSRPMELRPDGSIGRGSAGCEKRWAVHGTQLAICSNDNLTCLLTEEPDGVWRGDWVEHEKCGVELRTLTS